MINLPTQRNQSPSRQQARSVRLLTQRLPLLQHGEDTLPNVAFGSFANQMCKGVTRKTLQRAFNLEFGGGRFERCYLFLYLFLDRGEGREKEERNIHVWLLLTCPLLGTWPATQACGLTGNQISDPLIHRLALNHWATPAGANIFCFSYGSFIWTVTQNHSLIIL